MHVCLRDPTLLGELLSFLRRRDYIAVQLGEDTLLVSPPPGSYRLDAFVRKLCVDIDAWRQEHPSAPVILGPIDGGLSDGAA